MSLAQTVQYSAARHNQLVRDIAALDYVPSALSQHNAYLTDVRDRLRTSDGVIESLKKKTKKEWKEHVELKDSTMRKFGNTLIGRGAKFKERISKEERYVALEFTSGVFSLRVEQGVPGSAGTRNGGEECAREDPTRFEGSRTNGAPLITLDSCLI